MKRLFVFVIIALFGKLLACTIGIAHGSATPDGRPLIWKSRDTLSNPVNRILKDERDGIQFAYIANSDDNLAWMGANSKGFSIANSLCSDLGSKERFNNGHLILTSLKTCQSLLDFEELIDAIPNRDTRGCFAVFDASGECAMYEIGDDFWVKYPVNEEKGYAIRTNFSLVGGGTEGIERFIRSQEIINDLVEIDNLTPKQIIQNQMRDASDENSVEIPLPYDNTDPTPNINTEFSICRYRTTSAMVIQGVVGDEIPEFTTMWTLLGNPYTTSVIPIFPISTIPDVLSSPSGESLSYINALLKSDFWFAYDSVKYLDTSNFVDANGFSLLRNIEDREDELFDMYKPIINEWRSGDYDLEECDEIVEEIAYSTFFNSLDLINNVDNEDVNTVNNLGVNIYPNPFSINSDNRSYLTIDMLNDDVEIENVKIYNSKGQSIKNLRRYNNEFSWNGKDDFGNIVSNGIYFVRVSYDNKYLMKKILVLK